MLKFKGIEFQGFKCQDSDAQKYSTSLFGIEKNLHKLIFFVNRVMAFVQKAVARLNEPEKLTTLLKELGKKHFGYGAKQKYVDVSMDQEN